MSLKQEKKEDINLDKNISKNSKEMRIININGIQPKKYINNFIRTAKYNL